MIKLPNWAKFIYWIFILLGIGYFFLMPRIKSITAGDSVDADIIILVIFFILLLFPFFSEIEFFGIKVKKDIENLKKELFIKLGEIKNEVHSTHLQTVNITGFGPPPPDDKIPELINKIESLIEQNNQTSEVIVDVTTKEIEDIPEANIFLFKLRYNIEKEIKRIWENRFKSKKPVALSSILRELVKYEIIDGNFYSILKEVISLCNYGIHGGKISENQMEFVQKYADEILKYLKQIK